MSPQRRTRPDNVLPGDHHAMTPVQRRTHYYAGCTHDLCREAINQYNRDKAAQKKAAKETATVTSEAPPPRVEKIPALGASRRLQGLLFVGHDPVSIARATQISVDHIWWLLFELHTEITPTTHQIIDREFRAMRERLPSPTGKTSADQAAMTARAKTLAETQGWASPFAWEDIDGDEKPRHATTVGAGTRGKTQAAEARRSAVEESFETSAEAPTGTGALPLSAPSSPTESITPTELAEIAERFAAAAEQLAAALIADYERRVIS